MATQKTEVLSTVKVNAATGLQVVEPMNELEYADYQARQAEAVASEAEATAKTDARTSALNKLSALGLTQEEIDSL